MRRSRLPRRPTLPSFSELIYRVKAAEPIHRESQILQRIRRIRSRLRHRAFPPAHGREEIPRARSKTVESLGLDARLPDHRPPLVDLGLVVRAQRLGGLLLRRHDVLAQV